MCFTPEQKKAVAARLNMPEDTADDDMLSALMDDHAATEPAVKGMEKKTAELSAAKEAADKRVLELTAAVDAKEARVLELSAAAPRTPDPIVMGMYTDTVNARREDAVRSGAVSEAQAKGLDALIADADGRPTVLALTGVGPARKPLGYALWDWVQSLSAGGGVRTGNTATRTTTAHPPAHPQLPPLSGAGGTQGNGQPPPPADINRVNALRQEQGLPPLKELRAVPAAT